MPAAEPDSGLKRQRGGQDMPAPCYIGRERRHIMRPAEQQVIEKEVNGCQITLSFSASPVNGVIEKIQSIIIDIFFGLCYYNKAPLMKEAESKG